MSEMARADIVVMGPTASGWSRGHHMLSRVRRT
jgi:hypothetical protein